MITEPLTFTGRLTLQEILDLDRYHFRCVVRWPFRILLGTFSVGIVAVVIAAGIKSGFNVVSFCILAFCVYYPFGWLLHHRLAIIWRYRRHPEQFIEHTATITADSVSLSSVHLDLRLNWDRIGSIVATPVGLLFLLPPHNSLFWLPQRLFEGNHYRDDILELAAAHRIPIRQMI